MSLDQFGLVPHQCSTVKIGDRFGRLTVLATGKPAGSWRYQGVCQCDCGSPAKAIRLDSLTSGAVLSCGCFHREVHRTHGLTGHPLQSVHNLMMRRCYIPTDPAYVNYGGRGIAVCERWHDLANFVADLGRLHRPGLEMDRRNNDGNYEPSNVHFVTRAENCDNRRSGHKITYGGKTQSLTAWAKETGLHRGTLWERLVVWKWSAEKALTTPPIPVKERMALARAKSTANKPRVKLP